MKAHVTTPWAWLVFHCSVKPTRLDEMVRLAQNCELSVIKSLDQAALHSDK